MMGHDHDGRAHDHVDSPVTRPQLQSRATADDRKGWPGYYAFACTTEAQPSQNSPDGRRRHL